MRIQSILRKAEARGMRWRRHAIRSPEERALVLQLLSLADAMAAAEDKRAPNILCDYAFELAQNFSRFYAAHHILSESDAALRAAAAGPLRPDFGGFDQGSGPSGHRSSRKNVSKSEGLPCLALTRHTPLSMMHCNRPVRREARALWPAHDPSRERSG